MNVDISVAIAYMHCRERSMRSLSNHRLEESDAPRQPTRCPEIKLISPSVESQRSLVRIRLLSVYQKQQAPRTSIKTAPGAWFYWPITARLGSRDDRLLNGIQGNSFDLASRKAEFYLQKQSSRNGRRAAIFPRPLM
jgi:hypothetical protein